MCYSGWLLEFSKQLCGPPSIWLSRRAAVYSLTQHNICVFVDVQLHGMQRRQKVLLCCFRVISNTVAKCPQSIFLREMAPPGRALHSAMAALGLLLPWPSRGVGVDAQSLLHVCVGKQPLALGEGLGLHQSEAYSSQASLEQPVSCSR